MLPVSDRAPPSATLWSVPNYTALWSGICVHNLTKIIGTAGSRTSIVSTASLTITPSTNSLSRCLQLISLTTGNRYMVVPAVVVLIVFKYICFYVDISSVSKVMHCDTG